jgi:DNA-binding transcriptional ArsR family regulator
MRDGFHQVLKITAALSDGSRVRALLALRQGELCACQITELLGLAPSTVSRHIAILHEAGLVQLRKQGRWVYCRLPSQDAPQAVRKVLHWVQTALKQNPELKRDVRRLAAILKKTPEEICKRQLARSKSCSSASATPAAAKWLRAGHASSKGT